MRLPALNPSDEIRTMNPSDEPVEPMNRVNRVNRVNRCS
jgi:hypothetical protein